MTGTDLHGALVRLLNDLETLRRSLRLHPTSHPALQPARERIRARVLAMADDGEAAVLSFGPDQLFWNGEKVSLPPTAPAVKLVGLLFQLGLAALRLRFPQAGDGLPDLAGRIATLHEPPGESDRAYLLAKADSLSGVELVPLNLSGVQMVSPDAPTLPAGSRPVWAELAGDEMELLLDHPKAGLETLLASEQLPPLALIVVWEHHLYFNGTGYPRLGHPRRPHPAARLVTVADTFDLLFTARGGRGMMTREGTVAWLADREGSMLDPGWASALREVIQRPAGAHPPG